MTDDNLRSPTLAPGRPAMYACSRSTVSNAPEEAKIGELRSLQRPYFMIFMTSSFCIAEQSRVISVQPDALRSLPESHLRAPVGRRQRVHLLLILMMLMLMLMLMLVVVLILLMLRMLLLMLIHGLQMRRTSDVVKVRKPSLQPVTPPAQVGTRPAQQHRTAGPVDSHLVRERERRNLRHATILPHLRVYRLKRIIHGVSVLARVVVRRPSRSRDHRVRRARRARLRQRRLRVGVHEEREQLLLDLLHRAHAVREMRHLQFRDLRRRRVRVRSGQSGRSGRVDVDENRGRRARIRRRRRAASVRREK